MFQKYWLLALTAVLFAYANGQNKYSFSPTVSYKIIENGDSLPSAWAGGFNNPQFSSIDLNQDGHKDLVVFERSDNRILPFLNVQRGTSRAYRFAPSFIDSFPTISNWMLLVDYNCDGKEDIFCSSGGNSIGVYKNVSVGSGLKFEYALPGYAVTTTYPDNSVSELHNYDFDIPAIVDIDFDGDIDILTFSQGNSVMWNENKSNCGLDYYVNTYCWGRFAEGSLSNKLFLDGCGTLPIAPTSNKGMHAGSSILTGDLTGNGLSDVIVGDVSFNNAQAAFNTGQLDSAFMSTKDSIFPGYDTPIDLTLFPAFYLADVDFDGNKDLLVAPNTSGSRNINNVLLYKNTGTNNHITLSYTQDSSFLQKDMIDLGEGAIPVLFDIDNDGDLDLFVANSGQYLHDGNYKSYLNFYTNTGTNTSPEFTLTQADYLNLSTLNMGKSLAPAFGDLDNDGDPDLLIGATDGTLYHFANTGSSTAPNFAFATANYQNIDVGSNAAPFLFDIDNDGDLDLFIGKDIGTISYYENTNSSYATFTLVNDTYGGIDVRNHLSAQGNSKPVLFKNNDTVNIFVGSHNRGVVQYDSIANVQNLPPEIDGTLGTGNIASTGNNITPFGTSKRNGRNQLLFKASELKAAGFAYGKITSMSFHLSEAPSTYVSQGFSIRMKNVQLDSLTQWETDDLQETFNQISPMTVGWNEVTFTLPFLWDGESDLLIEICFSKNFPQTNINVTCTDVGFAANAYGNVAIWNQNTQNGCAMPWDNASHLRPNIKLKVTPTAVQTLSYQNLGINVAPTVGQLTNDGYLDMIIGSEAGGLVFYQGEEYVNTIGLSEERWVDKRLTLYPNPTNGYVLIELPEQNGLYTAEVKIIDLTGAIVSETTIENQQSVQLDLGNLPNGMYIVMLTYGQNTYHARLIKQE